MINTGGYAIEAIDVWRVYAAGGGQEVTALRGACLRLPDAGFFALKGRSGSGKTTLLNILGGLDQPTSGTVRVLGRDLASLSDRERTAWRSTHLGLVFQSFGLVQTLSAFENVDLMLRLAGVRGRERLLRAEECLEMVGMESWAHHRPSELSGGQQQRIAIARALANHPRLILADEATGELDSNTAGEILALFQEIRRREGVAILMTSHDPSVDRYVDQILTIQDGQVVEYGTTPFAAH